MRVFLLHRDRDFEVGPHLRDEIFDAMRSGNLYAIANAKRELDRQRRVTTVPASPGQYDGLARDLELETLWTAMASGDEFLYETAKRVVLTRLDDADEIRYRQQVLADCLAHPDVVGELYKIAIDSLASERIVGALWRGAMPDWILRRSVQLLELYLDSLRHGARGAGG